MCIKTGRVKVLNWHEKTVAHACEAFINTDLLLEGFIIGLGGGALNVEDPPREPTDGVQVGGESV